MITTRNLNPDELEYWNEFMISEDTLNAYSVHALDEAIIYNSKYKSSIADPIFCYEINSTCFKIYRPLTKDKSEKFRWIGKKPDDYIFGYTKLPTKGDLVYLTGGEKDVLCLADHGFSAITLNSETALPPDELIKELKERFDRVVVLYDIDDTGKKNSKKITEKFELHRCDLPKELASNGQKDISDFIKSGLIIDHLDQYTHKVNKPIDPKSDLSKILKSRELIKEKKSKSITFSRPLLMRETIPFLYPNTINVIQGKSGTHKSRLAQTICSSLITMSQDTMNLLQLKRDSNFDIGVCYVDTERNLIEQFPHGIQQILLGAGYKISDNPNSLDYVSLMEIDREHRFSALKSYLDYLNNGQDIHTLIVLDVTTDCLLDFNRTDSSMELVDLMNRAIHDNNVTFLCLIHENPGHGEKARGHLGTEIMNKSTNVIQVSFEMINNQPSDIIKIAFLKSRNNKRPDPIFVECTDELKFREVEEDRLLELSEQRQTKLPMKELTEWLGENLTKITSAQELDNQLCSHFDVSSKTLRNRLDKIHYQKTRITQNDKTYTLGKNRVGRDNHYYLELFEAKSIALI